MHAQCPHSKVDASIRENAIILAYGRRGLPSAVCLCQVGNVSGDVLNEKGPREEHDGPVVRPFQISEANIWRLEAGWQSASLAVALKEREKLQSKGTLRALQRLQGWRPSQRSFRRL